MKKLSNQINEQRSDMVRYGKNLSIASLIGASIILIVTLLQIINVIPDENINSDFKLFIGFAAIWLSLGAMHVQHTARTFRDVASAVDVLESRIEELENRAAVARPADEAEDKDTPSIQEAAKEE